MDNYYEIEFLKALFFTVSIETVVLLILTKKVSFFRIEASVAKIVLTGILASFATLPYVWFVFPAFIFSQTFYILTSEICAVVIEALIFYKIFNTTILKAVMISFICNMVSFGIGQML